MLPGVICFYTKVNKINTKVTKKYCIFSASIREIFYV